MARKFHPSKLFGFKWVVPSLISVISPWLIFVLYVGVYDVEKQGGYISKDGCSFKSTIPSGHIFSLDIEPYYCRFFRLDMEFVLRFNLKYPEMHPISSAGSRSGMLSVSVYPARTEARIPSIESSSGFEKFNAMAEILNVRGERVEVFRGNDQLPVAFNHRGDDRSAYRRYRDLQVVYRFNRDLGDLGAIDSAVLDFLDRKLKR